MGERHDNEFRELIDNALSILESEDESLSSLLVKFIAWRILRLESLSRDSRESEDFKLGAKSLLKSLKSDFKESTILSKNQEIIDSIFSLEKLSSFNAILTTELEKDSPVTHDLTQQLGDIIRSSLERSPGENPFYKLEKQWRILESREKAGKTVPTVDNSHPITQFVDWAWKKGYPPPELLYSMVIGFQSYIRAEGEISLDEAFFGRKHSKRYSLSWEIRAQKYQSFDDLLSMKHGNPKSFLYQEWSEQYEGLSRDKVAERFLSGSDTDVSTFLRGYDRWKEKNKV